MKNFKIGRDRIFIIAAAVFVLVFGAMYYMDRSSGSVSLTRGGGLEIKTEAAGGADEEIEPIPVTVHVAGEVKRPGVYELPAGSRVRDALDSAGGPNGEADLDRINLAAYLKDAQQIIIPRARADGGTGEIYYAPEDPLVNINTAGLRDLMTLPGVGEATAGSIIAYREKNGEFKQISDIKNVPRIGERTFELLELLICVE